MEAAQPEAAEPKQEAEPRTSEALGGAWYQLSQRPGQDLGYCRAQHGWPGAQAP